MLRPTSRFSKVHLILCLEIAPLKIYRIDGWRIPSLASVSRGRAVAEDDVMWPTLTIGNRH